jgi:hypothetical protein
MADRQCGHPFPTGVEERVATDEQCNSRTLGERCKGRLDVAVAAGFDNDEFLSARVRRGLHISQLSLGVRGVRVRVHEHRNRARLGHKLAQQLKPLRN